MLYKVKYTNLFSRTRKYQDDIIYIFFFSGKDFVPKVITSYVPHQNFTQFGDTSPVRSEDMA